VHGEIMDLSKKLIGKLINIKKNDNNKSIFYKGHLVDFSESDGEKTAIIKLIDNGYNVSVKIDESSEVTLLRGKIALGKPIATKLSFNPSLPSICYVGTGGTIGTNVDYQTGGVHMCRSPEEIISTTPELADIVNIKKMESPVMKASEDLGYKDWQKIADVVYSQLLDKDIDGVIITHGTDTLTWTGTALSFMIENSNKPVLLVGAQRSPDRASFDGAMNLVCAAHFIKEKIPGVFIVMHGTASDDFCYVTRAVKCRKMHTSRRDSFRAVNDLPIAKVYSDGRVEYFKDKSRLQQLLDRQLFFNPAFSDSVAILKAYPNSDPKIIDWYLKKGYKGLIIEGTGLGHVPTGAGGLDKSFDRKKGWLKEIKKAIDSGRIIIMASQSMFGRVNSSVYSNLRYAADAGVEYLDSHDMLAEVAYIKLGIALARFKDREGIINYMKKNVSGEISEKELPEAFDNFEN